MRLTQSYSRKSSPVMWINQLTIKMRHIVLSCDITCTHTWGYPRPLHFIQYSSDLSKIFQMCPIRVQSSLLAFPGGNCIDYYFRDTTGMHLEMEGPRNRILPDLKSPRMSTTRQNINTRQTIGNVLILISSHSGSSFKDSSSPSDSIPSPVGSAWAGAIQTYGWGEYRTRERIARDLRAGGKISKVLIPEVTDAPCT